MEKNIDDVIADLFKVIEDKKSKIAKLEKPNYKTNMSFLLNENDNLSAINLRVINDPVYLVKLLANLTNLRNEFININKLFSLNLDFTYSNYSYEDWRDDILALIAKVTIKKEKDDLDKKEAKLNLLISPEQRRKLEVELLRKQLED
jgi:hypothetical protein